MTGPVTQDGARLQGLDVQSALYQQSRSVSDGMHRLLKKFRKALKQCRNDLNYVSRDLVLQYCGESTKYAERKLREAWPRLLQDEGLVEIRVNRTNRLEYGLPAGLDSNMKIAISKERIENGRSSEVYRSEKNGNGPGEIGKGCELTSEDAVEQANSTGGGGKA
jgi:hypothetical protein